MQLVITRADFARDSSIHQYCAAGAECSFTHFFSIAHGVAYYERALVAVSSRIAFVRVSVAPGLYGRVILVKH